MPEKPLDDYRETAHVIRQARLMSRFFDEVVDADDRTRAVYDKLFCAYMDMLNRELAPYALALAMAIAELEDAYPEIERPEVPDRVTTG
jgi:hypothetical protein